MVTSRMNYLKEGVVISWEGFSPEESALLISGLNERGYGLFPETAGWIDFSRHGFKGRDENFIEIYRLPSKEQYRAAKDTGARHVMHKLGTISRKENSCTIEYADPQKIRNFQTGKEELLEEIGFEDKRTLQGIIADIVSTF